MIIEANSILTAASQQLNLTPCILSVNGYILKAVARKGFNCEVIKPKLSAIAITPR